MLGSERDPGQPPTTFPELNSLLRELVARVEAILGENFVGAYLQGSFAIGDADLHSDCDFLVVTNARVTLAQKHALRELHDEIPAREGHWTHHLEGSYAPSAELETLDGLGKHWLYIDHGAREMQWSTHCNTEVVRWTLREHGVTLAGPAPRELVREVSADSLRRSMRQLVERFLPDLLSWATFDTGWAQRYAVSTLCRMLYTLSTGEVASKRASLVWAKDALDPAWHGLIEQTLDDRTLGLVFSDPPRPGSVDATMAFLEYARGRAEELAAVVEQRGQPASQDREHRHRDPRLGLDQLTEVLSRDRQAADVGQGQRPASPGPIREQAELADELSRADLDTLAGQLDPDTSLENQEEP